MSNELNKSKSVTASFDGDALVKIMSMLSKVYKNPSTAVMREYTANAIDAIKDNPHGVVKVSLNQAMTTLEFDYLEVSDNGVGMNRSELENVLTKYGASTKEASSSDIGGFGIGSKSALSVSDEFYIRSVKDGKVNTISVKNVDGGRYSFDDEEITSEDSGTRVIIPLSNNIFNNMKSQIEGIYTINQERLSDSESLYTYSNNSIIDLMSKESINKYFDESNHDVPLMYANKTNNPFMGMNPDKVKLFFRQIESGVVVHEEEHKFSYENSIVAKQNGISIIRVSNPDSGKFISVGGILYPIKLSNFISDDEVKDFFPAFYRDEIRRLINSFGVVIEFEPKEIILTPSRDDFDEESSLNAAKITNMCREYISMLADLSPEKYLLSPTITFSTLYSIHTNYITRHAKDDLVLKGLNFGTRIKDSTEFVLDSDDISKDYSIIVFSDSKDDVTNDNLIKLKRSSRRAGFSRIERRFAYIDSYPSGLILFGEDKYATMDFLKEYTLNKNEGSYRREFKNVIFTEDEFKKKYPSALSETKTIYAYDSYRYSDNRRKNILRGSFPYRFVVIGNEDGAINEFRKFDRDMTELFELVSENSLIRHGESTKRLIFNREKEYRHGEIHEDLNKYFYILQEITSATPITQKEFDKINSSISKVKDFRYVMFDSIKNKAVNPEMLYSDVRSILSKYESRYSSIVNKYSEEGIAGGEKELKEHKVTDVIISALNYHFDNSDEVFKKQVLDGPKKLKLYESIENKFSTMAEDRSKALDSYSLNLLDDLTKKFKDETIKLLNKMEIENFNLE